MNNWSFFRAMDKEKLIRNYILKDEFFNTQEDVDFLMQFHIEELIERYYTRLGLSDWNN